MAKVMTVAEYLTHAIDMSGKSQKEIAREVGWQKPNMISMVKQGITKVPIEKAPALAKACGVDPAAFLGIVMREYFPEVWTVINKNLGYVLTEEERKMIDEFRASKETETS